VIKTLEVKATQVQVGDVVVGLSVVDYTVKRIKRVKNENVPADVVKMGGWVSLKGDTEDGYFKRLYGGQEDFYALPTEMITVQREVKDDE
jgi:hypothetical protein